MRLLAEDPSTLGHSQVIADILPGLLFGFVGILSLIVAVISCTCCSKRSSNDRRLSSYSSVKDTVQLEDLLSKPVLADPESVFSEPSIYCNRTPSVSNKSPSADSAGYSRDQLCSDSESEHFLYPSSPTKKISPDEPSPASLPSTSQFLRREAVSTKQKSSPKGSRKSARDKKTAGSGKALNVQSSHDNLSRPFSPVQAGLTNTDVLQHSPTTIKENQNVTIVPLEQVLATRESFSNTTKKLDYDGKQSKRETGAKEKTLTAEENLTKNTKAMMNAKSQQILPQLKGVEDAKPCDPKGTNNGTSPLQSFSFAKNEELTHTNATKQKSTFDVVCESTAMNNKTKRVLPGKFKLPETSSLNNMIANTGTTQLHEVREKNLQTYEPNHEKSILAPGRCSFSHETRHTANGSSKPVSSLISMSPVQERRLLSESPDSASPVTSSSPTESLQNNHRDEANAPAHDLSHSDKDEDVLVADAESIYQDPFSNQNKENLPIQMAAEFDGASASKIQARITPALVNVKGVSKLEDRVPLRRSFSEEVTRVNNSSHAFKTFSVNLQIDFHFANTEDVLHSLDRSPPAPVNLKYKPNNTEALNKPAQQSNADKSKAEPNKNVWLRLGKNNQSSANNDAEVLEFIQKRQILEKSFAGKSAFSRTECHASARRKRRSEPIMIFKTTLETNQATVSKIHSPTTCKTNRESQNRCKRPLKYRRSYAAGEEIQLHSSGKQTDKTAALQPIDYSTKSLEEAEVKRPRFESSAELTPLHHPANVYQVHNFGELKDSEDVGGHELTDFVEKKHLNITNEEVKLHVGAKVEIAAKLLSTEEEHKLPNKRGIKRRKTIPARIITNLRVVKTKELSRSDPIIFKVSEGSGIELLSLKPNVCHGSLDKCILDYPSTLPGNMMKQKPRTQSPVPKPRTRPRAGGIVSNTFSQAQSFEREIKVPKAKPRFSKSMEKLNTDSEEEEKVSVSACSEQYLPATDGAYSKVTPVPVSLKDQFNNKHGSLSAHVEQEIILQTKTNGNDQCQAIQILGEQEPSNEKAVSACTSKEGDTKANDRDENKRVPEIEVSDDDDYDNPWDSLDGAVQRASIRYNRRPSRIAAGVDTKTLLLQSAEDLGRLLEQAEKRRQLRQTVAKSSCPGEGELTSTDENTPNSVPFRFSPFRHTVKGLVSKPVSEASQSDEKSLQEFHLSRSGKYLKKSEMASRSQSLMKRIPQVQNTVEDEIVARRGRTFKNFSPPSRPKSLSVQEVFKTLSPETKKRKN